MYHSKRTTHEINNSETFYSRKDKLKNYEAHTLKTLAWNVGVRPSEYKMEPSRASGLPPIILA